jgi:hypothetical protein
MRRSIVLSMILVVAAMNHAEALCVDGVIVDCAVKGKPGTRECIGGRFGPCTADVISPPPPTHATMAPKYFVLTIIYAPPGTNGGRGSSSVSYGSGSSTGTTTSGNQSFKQNYSVSLNVSGGLPLQGSVGASFSYNKNDTDSQSLDIKKSSTVTITDSGPSKDGINHDHDIIYLWLNPKIDVSVTGSTVRWMLEDGGTADIQYAYVGWLKNPSTMPAGLTQRLQTYGITSQDFPDILLHDPYASGSPALDTARYQSGPIMQTFPYEPPLSAGDPVPTTADVVSNATTSTIGMSSEDDYKVGVTISAGLDIGVFKNKLQTDDSWTWTSTATKSASAANTESASVTVGGPAFGYTGPTDMAVYYDTIYKTFLFAPLEGAPIALKGTLTNKSGKSVALSQVSVLVNGVMYRSFTNARGQFRFFGKIGGPARIQAGGATKTLAQVPPGTAVNLRLP